MSRRHKLNKTAQGNKSAVLRYIDDIIMSTGLIDRKHVFIHESSITCKLSYWEPGHYVVKASESGATVLFEIRNDNNGVTGIISEKLDLTNDESVKLAIIKRIEQISKTINDLLVKKETRDTEKENKRYQKVLKEMAERQI